MKNSCVRILAAAFVLGLVGMLAGTLAAPVPRAQERPLSPRAGGSVGALPPGISTTPSGASYWARTYSGFMGKLEEGYEENDGCVAAQPGPDGGVVVAGYADSLKSVTFDYDERPLVVGLDSSGNMSWMVLYQEAPSKKGLNMVSSLIRTRDGQYLAAGTIGIEGEPLEEYHALVMKLAGPPQVLHQKNDPYHHYSYGPLLWVKKFGFGSQVAGEDEGALAAIETQDGGYVIAGRSSIIGPWIIKLDPSGHLLWKEGLGMGVIVALAATTDGVCSIGQGENGEINVISFGSEGDIQWQRSYSWAGPDVDCGVTGIFAESLSPTDESGFIMSGEVDFDSSCSGGSSCGWVCKLDQSGSLLWQKAYNEFYCHYGFATQDGGTVVMSDYVAMKLSPEGSPQWQKSYQDLSLTCGYQADDGGYVLGGWYSLPDSILYKFGVVRLDGNGNIGPGCAAVTGASITERKGAMTAVSATPVKISFPAIWMNTLENNSLARPCQIQTICGPSQSMRQTRFRGPVLKN